MVPQLLLCHLCIGVGVALNLHIDGAIAGADAALLQHAGVVIADVANTADAGHSRVALGDDNGRVAATHSHAGRSVPAPDCARPLS